MGAPKPLAEFGCHLGGLHHPSNHLINSPKVDFLLEEKVHANQPSRRSFVPYEGTSSFSAPDLSGKIPEGPRTCPAPSKKIHARAETLLARWFTPKQLFGFTETFSVFSPELFRRLRNFSGLFLSKFNISLMHINLKFNTYAK